MTTIQHLAFTRLQERGSLCFLLSLLLLLNFSLPFLAATPHGCATAPSQPGKGPLRTLNIQLQSCNTMLLTFAAAEEILAPCEM